MSHDALYRIRMRTGMSLRPGWLRVEPLPLDPIPGRVRLGPYVPGEVPVGLLPPDLRVIGSTFWMVFNTRREPVGFE